MGRHRPPDDDLWPHPTADAGDVAAHRSGEFPAYREHRERTRVLLCTRAAHDGWRLLAAADPDGAHRIREALATPPEEESSAWVRLRGDLADVDLDGGRFPRWQYRSGAVRVWFTVRGAGIDREVLVERIERDL